MVTAAFTGEPDAALLPAERQRLKDLADGGRAFGVPFRRPRSDAWLVLRADRPDAAQNVMESLPLYPYVEIRAIAEVQKIAPAGAVSGED
jgi:hypothetical protein